MYRLYLEHMAEKNPQVKVASERQYRDIFNTCFNIEIHRPKKDLCDECVRYDNTPPNLRTDELEAAHAEHVFNYKYAQKMKKDDTEEARKQTNTTLCVMCFDYEKLLNCPKADASIFYYTRKLGVCNFTLVDCGRRKPVCYVYDQTVARRGANEVASFLYHAHEERAKDGIVEIRSYSDNCPGQNKNRTVATELLFAASKFGVTIVHTYLEKGHTYNAADGIHGEIEKRSRGFQIYTPEEWIQRTEQTRRTKNPIKVIRVTQDMIFDFTALSSKLNLARNSENQPVPWTKLRQIKVDERNPGEIKYKISLADDKEMTIPINKVSPSYYFQFENKLSSRILFVWHKSSRS